VYYSSSFRSLGKLSMDAEPHFDRIDAISGLRGWLMEYDRYISTLVNIIPPEDIEGRDIGDTTVLLGTDGDETASAISRHLMDKCSIVSIVSKLSTRSGPVTCVIVDASKPFFWDKLKVASRNPMCALLDKALLKSEFKTMYPYPIISSLRRKVVMDVLENTGIKENDAVMIDAGGEAEMVVFALSMNGIASSSVRVEADTVEGRTTRFYVVLDASQPQLAERLRRGLVPAHEMQEYEDLAGRVMNRVDVGIKEYSPGQQAYALTVIIEGLLKYSSDHHIPVSQNSQLNKKSSDLPRVSRRVNKGGVFGRSVSIDTGMGKLICHIENQVTDYDPQQQSAVISFIIGKILEYGRNKHLPGMETAELALPRSPGYRGR